MRTSRISRDTAKYAPAILCGKGTSHRSFASSLAQFSGGGEGSAEVVKKEEGDSVENSTLSSVPSPPVSRVVRKVEDDDAEDSPLSSVPSSPVSSNGGIKKGEEVDEAPMVIKSEGDTSSRKRKRAATTVEGEAPSSSTQAKAKPLARRSKPPPSSKKEVQSSNGDVAIHTTPAPPRWEELYTLVKEMRARIPAPVDTDGCAKLADPASPPKDQRFQTLISLMLSSQTKDIVTAATIRSIHATLPGGLCLSSISALSAAELDAMIAKIGFHSTKAKNILSACTIISEKFDGDIPDTIEGLMSLPGVGPKMSYLCMTAAWGRVEGIGVDTHVHRLANMWGWVGRKGTKNPEETRHALEGWLPRPLWGEINAALVGFGQSVCLPVGRRCGVCDIGLKGGRGLCPGYIKPKGVAKKKEEDDEEEVKEVKEEAGVGDIEDLGLPTTPLATTRRRTTRSLKTSETTTSSK